MIDNVISAYEAVKMNGVSQGIIALCSFIAVIIVIQKFVTAWKEAFSEGDKPVDMKQFFKLFYIYIYVFAIIMVAPFAFTIVETPFAAIPFTPLAFCSFLSYAIKYPCSGVASLFSGAKFTSFIYVNFKD